MESNESYPEFAASVEDESNHPFPIEIGEDGRSIITPWDAFMSEPVRVGNFEIGYRQNGGSNREIGANVEIGNVEIGALLAVREVVKKARDNRMPAPVMLAVDVDAPARDIGDEWAVTDTFIGVAEATGSPDPFPLTTKFMQGFGGGGAPRFVRIDTEESYRDFRASQIPEMEHFQDRLDELDYRLTRHASDPTAHEMLSDGIEEVTMLGVVADQALAERRIDLQLGAPTDRKIDCWVDGENIYGMIKLPGPDGKVRHCTSVEPLEKSIQEASRHAAEAGVPASLIIDKVEMIGAILGAATAVKEMAAAAPSILARREIAGRSPFQVRIEPKANPALCALAALAQECRRGNAQACDEWQRLSVAGPGPVKQAMNEALSLLQRAA